MPNDSARSHAIRRLTERFPADRYSVRDIDRHAYATDLWPRSLIEHRARHAVHTLPDVVVWPTNREEVQFVVEVATEFRVPIVPWGAGSGVCGGATAIHGGITVDLKRMNRLLAFSAEDGIASFEAGIIGQHLEETLNKRGFTLGHFPSSIYCSTLGGWIATRSAGQYSTRYGNIEDMVSALTVVTSDRTVATYSRDTSPNLVPIFIGSEGTLGIITDATLHIAPLPEVRAFRGFNLPNVETGIAAMKQLMQQGLRPSVCRLYDELDTLLAKSHGNASSSTMPIPSVLKLFSSSKKEHDAIRQWKVLAQALSTTSLVRHSLHTLATRLSRGCLLIVGFEGSRALVDADMDFTKRIVSASGGRDLGDDPGALWFEHRYDVSYKQSPLFAAGCFADTFEIATSWSELPKLYRAVHAVLIKRAIALAHFSHAYPEGCSIYFTIVGADRTPEKMLSLYDSVWHDALQAALNAGGSISHHHGVGISKAKFMGSEHGEAFKLMRTVKHAMDPIGIFNPGKLGL